jgi:lipoate-protein ligase A
LSRTPRTTLTDPRFELVDPRLLPADGMQAEAVLLEHAATGEALAHLWEEESPGLVAPRSYLRHQGFAAVQASFASERGITVKLRGSGGGVVPQGPGLLNLSLVWVTHEPMGSLLDSVYQRLCSMLQRAFSQLGIHTLPREVHGSFCDGRFNLAVGDRKIVGTAQQWKRLGAECHAVLAHAVMVAQADPGLITGWANDFEEALGTGRRYDPGVIVSAHQCMGTGNATGALRLAIVDSLPGF